jgi:hypothetical protein
MVKWGVQWRKLSVQRSYAHTGLIKRPYTSVSVSKNTPMHKLGLIGHAQIFFRYLLNTTAAVPMPDFLLIDRTESLLELREVKGLCILIDVGICQTGL